MSSWFDPSKLTELSANLQAHIPVNSITDKLSSLANEVFVENADEELSYDELIAKCRKLEEDNNQLREQATSSKQKLQEYLSSTSSFVDEPALISAAPATPSVSSVESEHDKTLINQLQHQLREYVEREKQWKQQEAVAPSSTQSAEVESLKSQLSQLNSKLITAGTKLKSFYDENIRLSNEVTSRNESFAKKERELESHIELLAKECQASVEKIRQMEKEKQVLIETQKQQDLEFEKRTQKERELLVHLDKSKNENEALQKRLTELQSERSVENNKVQLLTKELDELKINYQNLQQQKANDVPTTNQPSNQPDLTQQLELEKAKLNTELEQKYSVQLSELNSYISTLVAENSDLKSQLAKSTSTDSGFNSQSPSASIVSALERSAQNQQFDERIASLQSELDASQAERQRLTIELKNMGERLLQSDKEAEDLKSKMGAHNQMNLEAHLEEAKTVKETVARLESENQKLRSEIHELRKSESQSIQASELKTWRETVKKLEDENQKLLNDQNVVHGMHVSEVTRLQNTLQKIEGENEKLRVELQQLSDSAKQSDLKPAIGNETSEAMINLLLRWIQNLDSTEPGNSVDSGFDGVEPIPEDLQTRLKDFQNKVKSKYNFEKENASKEIEMIKSDHERTRKTLVEELEKVKSERDKLNSDYQLLLEKLTIMKNNLAPKLQADMGDLKQLRQTVATLQTENSQLLNAISTLKTQLLTTETANSTLTSQLSQLASQNSKSQSEIERLKSYLLETEENYSAEILNLESQLQESATRVNESNKKVEEVFALLQVERQKVLDGEIRAAEIEREMEKLKSIAEKWKIDGEKWKGQVERLQGALDSLGQMKDSEIEYAVSNTKKQLTESLKELENWKSKVTSLESQLSTLQTLSHQTTQLESQLSEKELTISKLKYEIKILTDHLNEAMKKMNKKVEDDGNVDRQVVSNVLVSFCSAKPGDAKKFEMLQLLASLLQFTEEQKYLVGLLRQPSNLKRTPTANSIVSPDGGTQSVESEAMKEGFTDRWISFLLAESDTKQNPK